MTLNIKQLLYPNYIGISCVLLNEIGINLSDIQYYCSDISEPNFLYNSYYIQIDDKDYIIPFININQLIC